MKIVKKFQIHKKTYKKNQNQFYLLFFPPFFQLVLTLYYTRKKLKSAQFERSGKSETRSQDYSLGIEKNKNYS